MLSGDGVFFHNPESKGYHGDYHLKLSKFWGPTDLSIEGMNYNFCPGMWNKWITTNDRFVMTPKVVKGCFHDNTKTHPTLLQNISLTWQKIVVNLSNDRKNLDELKFVRLTTLRKKRGAKTAPQRVHFLVRRTDPFVAPFWLLFVTWSHFIKNGPSLPKRSRFPKWLLWGTILAPLFFWVNSN